MMHNVTIKQTVTLHHDFFDSIMVNALESGFLGEWSTIHEVEREGNQITSLRLQPEDYDDEGTIFTVNSETLAGTIYRVFSGDYSEKLLNCQSWVTRLFNSVNEHDTSNFDAGDCESLIQLSMFGEFVYG